MHEWKHRVVHDPSSNFGLQVMCARFLQHPHSQFLASSTVNNVQIQWCPASAQYSVALPLPMTVVTVSPMRIFPWRPRMMYFACRPLQDTSICETHTSEKKGITQNVG